jgi:hypothetical protein
LPDELRQGRFTFYVCLTVPLLHSLVLESLACALTSHSLGLPFLPKINKQVVTLSSYYAFIVALVAILIMNIFWGWKIFQVLYNFFTGPALPEDPRED